MLHKARKPKYLIGSYKPVSLTYLLALVGKRFEKAAADNPSKEKNQANLMGKNIASEKTGAQMITYSSYLKQLQMVFTTFIPPQVSFLLSRKTSTKFGLMSFSLS